MKIKEIIDQKEFNDFVANNTTETFLQSWEWGNFNRELGHQVFFYGLYDGSTLISTALVIKISARRGRFLFIPHGPIINKENVKKTKEIIQAYTEFLKSMAINHDCSFVRIAPISPNTDNNIAVYKSLSYYNAPMHMHSELCWVLDLKVPEEQLLKNMRKTTRYLIKQKEKYDIKIKKSHNVSDLKEFCKIYDQTQKRQGFVAFSKDYINKEFMAFSPNKQVSLYFAYYNNTLLSTAFIITCGKTGFYHHGASSLELPKIPASYILQWEIIKDLKKSGFDFYNFWGIAPQNKPNHPWQGLTSFKKGFGGEEVAFLHTQDLRINWDYWKNWLIETLRRIKRHY